MKATRGSFPYAQNTKLLCYATRASLYVCMYTCADGYDVVSQIWLRMHGIAESDRIQD